MKKLITALILIVLIFALSFTACDNGKIASDEIILSHEHHWVYQLETIGTIEVEETHAICDGCGIDLTETAEKKGMEAREFLTKHLTGDGTPECPNTLGNKGKIHWQAIKKTIKEKAIAGFKCSTCGATQKF